jgi:hypothetical protein
MAVVMHGTMTRSTIRLVRNGKNVHSAKAKRGGGYVPMHIIIQKRRRHEVFADERGGECGGVGVAGQGGAEWFAAQPQAQVSFLIQYFKMIRVFMVCCAPGAPC